MYQKVNKYMMTAKNTKLLCQWVWPNVIRLFQSKLIPTTFFLIPSNKIARILKNLSIEE